MKYCFRFLCGSVALSAVLASAQTLPKFWNTGEGLTTGQSDAHWMAEKVQGSTPFTGSRQTLMMDPTTYPVAGAYTNRDYTNSHWISFSADGYCSDDDIFKFTQRFYIDPDTFNAMSIPDSNRIKFTGIFSSDNASEMFVNGHRVAGLSYWNGADGYSFEARRHFDASQWLVGGWNDVSFLVGSGSTMGANVGPGVEWMGLRTEGKLELAPVPEPASLAALALGVSALARRRRRG